MNRSTIYRILFVCTIVLLVQILASFYTKRWDLTSDNRYSLSDSSKEFIKSIDQPIRVDVFLNGKLPQEYQRLRSETEVILQSITSQNDRFYYEFIDPFKGTDDTEQLLE